MNTFLLALLCFACTSCASKNGSQLPYLPYSELSGPVPPHTPLSDKNTRIKKNESIRTKDECIRLLEECLTSQNRQVVYATLASYSLAQLSIPDKIAERLITRTYDPYLQLQVLSALYATQSNACKIASEKALLSEIPIIQLYALTFLTKSHSQDILSRITALEAKIPSELLPYCAELYAIEGSPQAQLCIKRILQSGNSAAVSLCLCLIRDFQLMELYPELETFHPLNSQEQEAYAYALGNQNTQMHHARLLELMQSNEPSVAMRACISLCEFGNTIEPPHNLKLSPFILASLHKTSISTKAMEDIWDHSLNSDERLNLALSLLERRSTLPLHYLFERLQEGETLLFEPNYSLAGTCSYLTEHAPQKTSLPEELNLRYISQSIQEQLVDKIATFFPTIFETMAPKYLLEKSNHLAPAVIVALSKSMSESASALLHELTFKPGQPFVRQLAIFAKIQRSELPLDPKILRSLMQNLRESLETLSRPTWLGLFQPKSQEDSHNKKRTEQQNLYFAAISTLAQIKTEESATILTEEIQSAPEQLVPLVTAALLYSLL